MQRSLFVFAFGLSLFVAHADDSVKRLGKDAVVQVPPQDERGTALYARVALILDKDGNPFPSTSQDVPIIMLAYDVDLEKALIAVAVRTGYATDVSMAFISGLIIEASDGDVAEEAEAAELPEGIIVDYSEASGGDAEQNGIIVDYSEASSGDAEQEGIIVDYSEASGGDAEQNGIIVDYSEVSDGEEPEAQTLSVTEAYEDELVLPDGIIVDYIQAAAPVRVSRGVLVVKSCSMDTLLSTKDSQTYVAVLEVTWNGNVYKYHFTKEPKWSPEPWWYWDGEFWYEQDELFYPSYHNCPSFPDYAMYCYDWPRFLSYVAV